MFQGIIILWHHRLIPNGTYRCRSTKGVIRHPGISYSYFSGAVAKLVLCDGEAVCVSTVWILILFNSGESADWLVFFLYDSLNQVALAASFILMPHIKPTWDFVAFKLYGISFDR